MLYEFGKFAKEWEFVHSLSETYHSQCNGKAEAAVNPTAELGTSPLPTIVWKENQKCGSSNCWPVS